MHPSYKYTLPTPLLPLLTFSPCSGYSQLKKTADKIYAFDDLRASSAQAKAASAARPLFPDRTLPPMATPPVSLQPPCVFPRTDYRFKLRLRLTRDAATRRRTSPLQSHGDGSLCLRTSARAAVSAAIVLRAMLLNIRGLCLRGEGGSVNMSCDLAQLQAPTRALLL